MRMCKPLIIAVFLAGTLPACVNAREPWLANIASEPGMAFDPIPVPTPSSVLSAPAETLPMPSPSSASPAASAASPPAAASAAATGQFAPNNDPLLMAAQQAGTGACGPLGNDCPGYRLYAVADALFLARNAALEDRPLVLNEDTGATLISSQSLQWGFAPGVRAFFGERKPVGWGWEVGYLGIYNSTSSQQVFGPGNLIAPGNFGITAPQFNTADLMQLDYVSTLNMGEANIFWYDCCGTGQAPAGQCQTDACAQPCGSCRCIDWLVGFRYAGLSETAGFTSTCCGLTETSAYDVTAGTTLFGGQIGVRGRRDYQHWAMEGWLKVGLAGTWLSQTQAPVVDPVNPDPLIRGASSASATGLGGFADANASLIYRLNRHWGVRAGFNVIWLGNVALAADQWNFNQVTAVDSVSNSSLLLLGGNLGVEARW